MVSASAKTSVIASGITAGKAAANGKAEGVGYNTITLPAAMAVSKEVSGATRDQQSRRTLTTALSAKAAGSNRPVLLLLLNSVACVSNTSDSTGVADSEVANAEVADAAVTVEREAGNTNIPELLFQQRQHKIRRLTKLQGHFAI